MSAQMREALERLCDACDAIGKLPTTVRIAREALAQPEQRGEVIPQYRRRGAIEWYDGYADHEDSCGPYEERVVYTAPPAPAVPPEVRNALLEALYIAMRFALEARIPECGHFGAIAQNLDYVCTTMLCAPAAPAVPDWLPAVLSQHIEVAERSGWNGLHGTLVACREALAAAPEVKP